MKSVTGKHINDDNTVITIPGELMTKFITDYMKTRKVAITVALKRAI